MLTPDTLMKTNKVIHTYPKENICKQAGIYAKN